MHIPKVPCIRTWAIIALVFSGLVLSACSINVKKDNNGQDKNVDINTPLGGIHVDKNADVRDTGLPVYPGARVKPKTTSGEGDNANVNISGLGYGLKVVAIDYESADPPEKIVAYYKDQLKKYGAVLECHTAKGPDVSMNYGDDSKKSKDLTCGSETGKDIELKVGTQENQHIVSIKSQSQGSSFALVYVQMRGRDTTI